LLRDGEHDVAFGPHLAVVNRHQRLALSHRPHLDVELGDGRQAHKRHHHVVAAGELA
jgi:hypothetical protein